MQGSNGDADIENRLVGTVKERVAHTERVAVKHISPYVKQAMGGKLLCNTGSSAWCCDNLGRGWWGDGRGV